MRILQNISYRRRNLVDSRRIILPDITKSYKHWVERSRRGFLPGSTVDNAPVEGRKHSAVDN